MTSRRDNGPGEGHRPEHLRVPTALASALIEVGLSDPDRGAVFAASQEVSDDWRSVLDELTDAFEQSRAALRAGRSMVYVVTVDDLLGRRGAGRAMVAAGLLSAARTASLEGAKGGVSFNILAVDDDSDPAVAATWIERLLEPNGPSGEVIRLGRRHLGKVLP